MASNRDNKNSIQIRKKKKNNDKELEKGSGKTCLDEKAEQITIERSKIVKFIKRTLEKTPNGLRTEFQAMKRTNNWEAMKAFKAANELGKNRYKDVGCLDASRVKLQMPPWDHEYIHGNFVSTPSNPKRFICTQAPMEKTCADFWFMCLTERVEVIFMLCNLKEKGANKCFEYFPSKGNETLTFEEGSHKITVKMTHAPVMLKFTGEDVKAKVKLTTVIVEGAGERPLRTNHYHWIDWPDRGVPPADSAIIQLLEKTRGTKYPMVVHCSAGIGRTGSVVMIEYMLDQISRQVDIEDTDKILLKIRDQRNNSVQTDHQYLFVHQVYLNYFKFRGVLPADIEAHLEKFTKEYHKLVI
ncbi:unnamed protein product [Caenorhabditis auriculariae]|uniref:Protein-tyrosine phosphatase n=1 Tax=Caenorhabditis auriculariae TaxID=2777116 RepID=A0A8S1GZ46_9PELO|nr:unnamed protein product [Caenorhabditis auriculariae]